MKITSFAPALVLSAVSLLAVACDASTSPPAATYPSAPPAAAPAQPPSAAAPAGASATNTLALNAVPSNGTAQPIDPTLAGAAGAVLNSVAGSMAPGASREGAPMAAVFQPGQTMEQVVPLQTGRCYTVLASGPTIQAWDFSMVLIPGPIPVNPVIAHEAQSGQTAALGGNGNCFQWNWPPAQARVVVKVTQGQGIAAAQLYGK